MSSSDDEHDLQGYDYVSERFLAWATNAILVFAIALIVFGLTVHEIRHGVW